MNDELQQRNRDLVRRTYREILMNRDVDDAMRVYDEVFDDAYVDHMLFDYPVMAPDKAALREQIRMMISSFSDIEAEIIHLFADGDKVAHYASFRARHTGVFLGLPASGKTVAWKEVHMSIVKDGRVIEHWGHIDIDAIFRQLGVQPPRP